MLRRFLLDGQTPGPFFELRNAVLEHVRRWVHDTGVDRSKLLKRKQLGAVLCALEGKRG